MANALLACSCASVLYGAYSYCDLLIPVSRYMLVSVCDGNCITCDRYLHSGRYAGYMYLFDCNTQKFKPNTTLKNPMCNIRKVSLRVVHVVFPAFYLKCFMLLRQRAHDCRAIPVLARVGSQNITRTASRLNVILACFYGAAFLRVLLSAIALREPASELTVRDCKHSQSGAPNSSWIRWEAARSGDIAQECRPLAGPVG